MAANGYRVAASRVLSWLIAWVVGFKDVLMLGRLAEGFIYPFFPFLQPIEHFKNISKGFGNLNAATQGVNPPK